MAKMSALLACVCALLCALPAGAQRKKPMPENAKRGDFVFFSNRVFTAEGKERAEEIETIKRFRVCLTNGYENFSGKERDSLRAAGCDLFLYLWFNGYYEKELGFDEREKASIQRYPDLRAAFREIHSHPEWLLNPKQPIQGGGADFPAYFYDYGNPAFRAYYVGFIRERLQKAGYNGVFFDYIGGWALPEAARKLWQARYPKLSYDAAGVTFLKELRAAIPDVKLFGNQAYRLSPDYYDCLDYDISESHGTSFVWGKEARIFVQGKGMQAVRETFYRPWDGPAGYRAISQPRRDMMAQRPRVQVFDLNYLQPWYVPTGAKATVEGKEVPVFAERTDRPAIFYGYALAKLTGITAYASDWYAPGFGQDDLYFLDLGDPVEPMFHEEKDSVVRYFRNGFVVVTRRGGQVSFAPDAKCLPANATGLWDVYERKPVPEGPRGPVTIHPASYPATQSDYPSGRVYLYRRD